MLNTMITAEQGEALHTMLSDFVVQAEANAVFVCDTGGNIIDHVSHDENESDQTIAALASGSFAATGELAGLIGEPKFRSIFHKGEHASIYMQSLGANHLMLVIFGEGTTLGLVKLYIERTSGQIEALLLEMSGQTMKSAGIAADFSMSASGRVFRAGEERQ